MAHDDDVDGVNRIKTQFLLTPPQCVTLFSMDPPLRQLRINICPKTLDDLNRIPGD